MDNSQFQAATALNRYANFFTRFTVAGGLSGVYSKTFLNLAADRFIMGYDDSLYSISKNIMMFQDKKLADKLGLLSMVGSWKFAKPPVNVCYKSFGTYKINTLHSNSQLQLKLCKWLTSR